MKPSPAIDKLIAPLFCNTENKPTAYIVDIDLLDAPLSIHRRLSTSGYAELLRTINNHTDIAFENTLKWIGPDFDPYYFGYRLTQARINDFQRTIGEARWDSIETSL